MAGRTGHVLAAGVSVLAGAGVAVVTNVATNQPSWSWGAGLVAVVVLWAGIEMWRAWGQDTQKNVHAGGPGAVAVGGNARGRIRTWLRIRFREAPPATEKRPPKRGVSADGPGSVAVGGDAEDVETDVTEEGSP